MKKMILILGLATAGGFVGAVVAMRFIPQSFLFPQSATILPSVQQNAETAVSPVSRPTQEPDAWQTVAAEAARSSVAIQVIQSAQLIRSGSGIMVSADGLILTTADLVASGPFIYQVLYDDRILRGVVVERDYQNNLALLKIEGSDFNIANFVDILTNIQPGRELIAAGRFMDVSRPTLFAQRALVQYSSEKTAVLDTAAKPFLNGAQVLDVQGRIAGMISLRSGKVTLVLGEVITDFISAYLDKAK